MGLMWGTMISVCGLVSAIAIAVAARVLSDDAKEWLPWITRHLLERAVARLPEDEREKRREEWNSDVNEWPGNLAKVYRALGYLSAASAIRDIEASMTPLTPEHPRWDEFVDRLSGLKACDPRDHTMPFCRSIMQQMGLSRKAIAASLAYFEEHGGYCDCEVLLNVGQSELD